MSLKDISVDIYSHGFAEYATYIQTSHKYVFDEIGIFSVEGRGH